MIKAINLSTYQYDMDRYNNNYKNVNKFLEDNNINAIELFGLQLYNEELIPKDRSTFNALSCMVRFLE